MKIITVRRGQLRTAILSIAVVCAVFAMTHGHEAVSAVNPSPPAGGGVSLPIIMYHSILKDPSRANDYVLSPSELERDMLWLQQNGYQTVTAAQAAAYVRDGGDFPEKPVMLTFDDGYLNNLVYVLPLLEKYQMNAVIAVVGQFVDNFSNTPDPNPNYGHLTWGDVTTLQQSGFVEIANHSWAMHGQKERKGASKMRSETQAQYIEALTSDVNKLQKELTEHCGITPVTFAYPYGQISPGADEALRKAGFQVTLSCYSRVDKLVVGDESSLFSLGRYNRPSGVSTEQFMKKMMH